MTTPAQCLILLHLFAGHTRVFIPYDMIASVKPVGGGHSKIILKNQTSAVFQETEDQVYEQMHECWKQELAPFYDWLDWMLE